MRLSKGSEYAIRCLVFLARSGEPICSVKTLSEELGIPYKFLGRIMSTLAESGLVEATRGQHGGYSLNHPLEQVTVEKVISAVEGLDDFDRCILGFPTCDDTNPCSMHEQWKTQREGIVRMIRTVTLADLAGDHSGKC